MLGEVSQVLTSAFVPVVYQTKINMEINVIIIRMWSKNLFRCQEEIKLKFLRY